MKSYVLGSLFCLLTDSKFTPSEVTYDMLLCKKYVTIMVLGIDSVIELVVMGVE